MVCAYGDLKDLRRQKKYSNVCCVNPPDNQGVRFIIYHVKDRKHWREDYLKPMWKVIFDKLAFKSIGQKHLHLLICVFVFVIMMVIFIKYY